MANNSFKKNSLGGFEKIKVFDYFNKKTAIRCWMAAFKVIYKNINYPKFFLAISASNSFLKNRLFKAAFISLPCRNNS